jgi:hypothetical protein
MHNKTLKNQVKVSHSQIIEINTHIVILYIHSFISIYQMRKKKKTKQNKTKLLDLIFLLFVGPYPYLVCCTLNKFLFLFILIIQKKKKSFYTLIVFYLFLV